MLRLLLIGLCLFFGFRLITASEDLTDVYASWGFSNLQMLLAGYLQICAALFLLFKSTELLALLALWSLSSIALATHWRLEHELTLFIPGIVICALVLGRAAQLLQRRSFVLSRAPQNIIGENTMTQDFNTDQFEMLFTVKAREDSVAQYLNKTETFTRGQIPPYRVEFIDPQTHRETNRFEEGVLTNHFGPMLNLPGRIMRIDGSRYRDLIYSYGAYAISNRLFRPTRLEFWFESQNSDTQVRLRLTTACRHGWKWLWRLGMYSFWPSFVCGLKLWALFRGSSK